MYVLMYGVKFFFSIPATIMGKISNIGNLMILFWTIPDDGWCVSEVYDQLDKIWEKVHKASARYTLFYGVSRL